MNNWQCKECDWIGPISAFLKDRNPFDELIEINGCPDCKSIDQFRQLCDVPGCNQESSCGFPTPDNGYRRTCGKHMREADAFGGVVRSPHVVK